MVENIRTRIYKTEIFDPVSGIGYGVGAFYHNSDELTDYSPETLESELNALVAENLLQKEKGYYRATIEGKIARLRHLAEKGVLSKVLRDQRSYSLNDLILAILASDHVDPFTGHSHFSIEALSIYLYEFSPDMLKAAIVELKNGRLIGEDALYEENPLRITGIGLQKYKTDSRIKLNLGKNEGILRFVRPVEKDARFSKLEIDTDLQDNLEQRWREMKACADSGAYLAATIMLGSIQEGALLAKLKKNPEAAMTSSKAPKGKNAPIKSIEDWTLAEYITVAADLGYVPRSVVKHLHELRDTRNLVHPQKQTREQITVDEPLYRISREIAETVIDALSISDNCDL